MCPRVFAFRWSTIAASVVDFPELVGPVTRMSPARCWSMRGIAGGQPEAFDGGHLVRDHPKRTRDTRVPPEDVDPEAGRALERVRAVELTVLLEVLDLVFGEQLVDEDASPRPR